MTVDAVKLYLRDGTIATAVGPIGMHVQVMTDIEPGGVATRIVGEQDCLDAEQFRLVWRKLGGGSFVDEDGEPIELD